MKRFFAFVPVLFLSVGLAAPAHALSVNAEKISEGKYGQTLWTVNETEFTLSANDFKTLETPDGTYTFFADGTWHEGYRTAEAYESALYAGYPGDGKVRRGTVTRLGVFETVLETADGSERTFPTDRLRFAAEDGPLEDPSFAFLLWQEEPERDFGDDDRIYLARGSKGDEVRELQTALVQLGFLSGAVDGDFGGMTRSAVTAFQQSRGLPQTGDVTGALMKTILEALQQKYTVPLLTAPEEGAEPVTCCPAGRFVLVREEDGNWARIRYRNFDGYVPCENLEPAVFPLKKTERIVTAEADGTFEPSRQGGVFCTLEEGETVSSIGEDGDWYICVLEDSRFFLPKDCTAEAERSFPAPRPVRGRFPVS